MPPSPNMNIVPATVFTNPDVHLRVWFDDGTNGSQLLTPDQRIAAVGYAMMAATVADGAITSSKIAAGAVGGAQLAEARRADQLVDGVLLENLNAAGQSGVASGGLVLSATENHAAGQRRVCPDWRHGYDDRDAWQQRSNGTTPAPATITPAVWTGSEMIVWGGYRRQRLFERRRALQSGGQQLDGGEHHRRARRASRPHGGVDGQRDDRLGRSRRRRLFERRRALQSGGQQLDGRDHRPARPPRAAITRRCGRAAR